MKWHKGALACRVLVFSISPEARTCHLYETVAQHQSCCMAAPCALLAAEQLFTLSLRQSLEGSMVGSGAGMQLDVMASRRVG